MGVGGEDDPLVHTLITATAHTTIQPKHTLLFVRSRLGKRNRNPPSLKII